MAASEKWWARSVVYQIYPRSFMDSTGNGVGDLNGITSKLDYLKWLGVDAIWLSPMYPSPMADFGYDISDYTDVHPLFGTLADFDALLAAAHERDLKLLLDFVPNHTSDQHAWFIESRASRDNPKRDWYIWADPKPDGSPPNNWISHFGGAAWTLDEATGQYYLHNFAPEQPDLNWRHPEVKAAMFDNLRFWLDRGIDGFRVDVIDVMLKDAQLRDEPPNPDYDPRYNYERDTLLHLYSAYQPDVHDLIKEMRGVLDEYGDKLLVGEVYYHATLEEVAAYYADGVHLPFNFKLITSSFQGSGWDAASVRLLIDRYESLVPAGELSNYVMGNHDTPRVRSRLGDDQVRMAAVLLLTLPGVPFIYYGEEIGMRDGDIPDDKIKDPLALRFSRDASRDPERTPMQWDGTANAGFTTGEPWLPIPEDYESVNVKAQRDDPASTLSLYRALLQLRKDTPALSIGDYRSRDAAPDTFMFERQHEGQTVVVAINFADEPRPLDVTGRVLLSTHANPPTNSLLPNEGRVVEITA